MTSTVSENSALSMTMQVNKMLQPEEVAAMMQLHGLGRMQKTSSRCQYKTSRTSFLL
ncbi:hypothetical protein [Acidocella aminolytica]|jgi:hypothetical protein|uniref:hypothetical protein n=1 Tax=Acidocella aminolytica TaxID=33998 RepID=UPI000917D2B7|nr:hypothetical protein [Acidocella aminolytica]SHF48658.1 hypothetical protein SAMN02746095_03431 [Acidocella aminolytica 101 = DSM 11237]